MFKRKEHNLFITIKDQPEYKIESLSEEAENMFEDIVRQIKEGQKFIVVRNFIIQTHLIDLVYYN
jgi:hypothetical protein